MMHGTPDQQVAAAQQRLEGLRQRAGRSAREQVLLAEALEELSTALEELHVTMQELRQQNEALVATQQEAEEEHQRYRELFEFAPDGYLVTDSEATILEANRAAASLLHIHQDFLVGKPLQVFVVKEQRQAFHTKLTQLQSEDEKIVREWRIRMQPRKAPPFPAALTVSLGRDAKGRLVGLRWLLRDVTERERLEALQETEQQLRGLVHEQERQLIISDRLVSFAELTASLAHEFNNPLEIILGFAQDLLTEVDPQHPHYQPLQMIENEASRCKKLMRDLMGFARPINTQPRLTDLQDVVGKSLDLVSGQLQKGKINIAVEVQTDLPQIYADAQQLEQVLLNLYFNAIEAMPEGGVLTVRVTAKSAKAVVMTVTDTGLGIHPHDLPNIYRPFFTAKKTKGMGLGLSVCESIMKTHGGKIKVESLPGRGTTFHLYLPVERRTGDRNFRSHSRRGR